MSTAVAIVQPQTPAVTAEQLDLVRRTVAKDATPDELKLYLYDCARQGVHPLDKLIHFTKRSGKYTPVTSIDFMRIRAADTGEYAGSDDAVFAGEPQKADFASQVTVWRLVQGHRVSFTATARWTEYKPDANDFMWRKMPHTMLAKCAEALALRKGFPRQLAGLYAHEEMAQAENQPAPPAAPERVDTVTGEVVSSAPSDGLLRVVRVDSKPTQTGKARWLIALSDGRECWTFREQLSALAEACKQAEDVVTVEVKNKGKWGADLEKLERVKAPEPAPVSPLDDEARNAGVSDGVF